MGQLNPQPDFQKTSSTSPQPWVSLALSPDLEVASPVEAATALRWHAGVPIKDEPLITLTPLKAPPGAGGGSHEGSTGEVTGASAELVVAVWGAGQGWGKRKKAPLLGQFQNCAEVWSKFEGFQEKKKAFFFNLKESLKMGGFFLIWVFSSK